MGAIPDTSPSRSLRALVERGHTVAELERALGLSPGYLSKVRHGAVRPSRQLVALLEVLRMHPAALATVQGVARSQPSEVSRAAKNDRAAQKQPRAPGAAPAVLRALAPELARAKVRWGLAGAAGLRAHGADAPVVPGVDIIVHDADRHVLRVLRESGLRIAHHAATLSIGQLENTDPNDAIRVHFPTTPPLATAHAHTLRLRVDGRMLPVVDAAILALGELLSNRRGADENLRAALDAELVTVAALRRKLDALDRLPSTRSPALLRVFDRVLARRRLEGLRRR
jgi:transcriptional regulator with XRE-family HTH domain